MPNLSSHIQTFSNIDAPYAGADFSLEGLDGFNQVTGDGGDITWDGYKWIIDSHQTLNGNAELQKIDELPLYPYTWTKRHQMRTRIQSCIANDPLGSYWIFHGDPYAPFEGFGLIFTPTQIIGRAGDAQNYTDLVLFDSLTPGDTHEHLYEIIFYPGNGVYFYADGVYIGKITTNLPSSTPALFTVFDIMALNLTDQMGGLIALSRVQLSQDL